MEVAFLSGVSSEGGGSFSGGGGRSWLIGRVDEAGCG